MSKKLIIDKENFFRQDIFTEKYEVRFRIVSEDRNNLSYWSPIFSVDPGFDFIPGTNISIERTQNQTYIAWESTQIEKDGVNIGTLPIYDVWIRWGFSETEGAWEYYGEVTGSSINIVRPISIAAINYVSVEVYRPMSPPDYRITVYEVDQSNSAGNIDLTNDWVIFNTENFIQTGDALRYTSPNPILGLNNNTTYYARKVFFDRVTLHPTKEDAENGSNLIKLSSHTNEFGYFKWEESTVYDFLLYSEYNVPSA